MCVSNGFLTSQLEIVEITVCLEGFGHARAAAAAMCILSFFFARDGGPRRRADVDDAVRSERKSCHRSPRVTGMLKNHWFLKDSARARGWIFRFF